MCAINLTELLNLPFDNILISFGFLLLIFVLGFDQSKSELQSYILKAAPTPAPAPATATVKATPAPAPAAATNNNEAQKKSNRIQVSNTKKPLFFYVNLAKRYMQQHNEVELSALGMAITTVVTVAEILKNGGFAIEKKVLTSTVGMKDEAKGRMVQKARIEIVLTKSEKFDKLMTPNNNNNNNNSERAVAQDAAAVTKTNNDNKEQNKK